MKLDNNGNITGYIFAPSLDKWHQEMTFFERHKKDALYYSFHHLIQLNLYYDIKSRPNKIQGFYDNNHHSAVHYLSTDAKKFDQALEEQKCDAALSLGFDVKECKVHMHRVWKFIQHILTHNVDTIKQKNSYDEATGELINNGISIKFTRSKLPSIILSLLYPNGKPTSNNISFEDVYYQGIKTDADPEWYDLTQDEITKINHKIYKRALNFVIPDNTTIRLVK